MSAAAISGTGSNTAGQVGQGFAAMSSTDFIKVLTSELSHQDPFKPQDSAALLEQFSSLRNIESQLQLQESLKALVTQSQMASAAGMIGKLVAGLDDENNQIVGLVSSIRMVDGKVTLELDSGKTLSFDRVTEIAEAPQA